MLRVRTGDVHAYELLYRRYQRRLADFFYGLSRDAGLADDLVHETFLRIWRLRARYAASGSFPAYVFTIARNIWLEECRTRRKSTRLGRRCDLDAGPELSASASARPDVRAERSELGAALVQALDALPEEQRTAFLLRTVQRMSLDDIARVMGCPVNTVRSRKLLAVKKLRELLAAVFCKTDLTA